MDKKARVFISCGQIEKEKDFGEKLVKYFENRGFEAYFAENIHSFQALTENIFDSLKESEYFVGINSMREQTGNAGSVFVQQEIALASFLGLPLVLFRQKGIKLQGVSKYIIANSIEFSDVSEIITILDKATSDWDTDTKNRLDLSIGDIHQMNALNGIHVKNIWHHIAVENLSKSLDVKGCYAYLESIYDLNVDPSLKNNLVKYKIELMWAGIGDVVLNLPRGSKRDLDAFYTVDNGMNLLHFHQRSTSGAYRYDSLPKGKYLLVYTFLSDSFSARCELKIEFDGKKVSITSFKQLD